MKNKNTLFVCGLIGSGKDTVVEELQNFDYTKIRIARTIKGIIQDVFGFTNDELEYYKRETQEIRDMHHNIADMMNAISVHSESKKLQNYIEVENLYKEKSNNRCKLIANRNSIEFENKIDKFVVSDVRSLTEMEIFFKENKKIIGIFLLRSHKDLNEQEEYVKQKHWTNALDYNNNKLIELLNNFKSRVIVIDNRGNDTDNRYSKFYELFQGKIIKIDFEREKIDKKMLKNCILDLMLTSNYF